VLFLPVFQAGAVSVPACAGGPGSCACVHACCPAAAAPALPAMKCAAVAGARSQGRAPEQDPGIILVKFSAGSESIPKARGQQLNSLVLLPQL